MADLWMKRVPKTSWARKIIHIDMDAFFAAVEQRDNPEYRAKPVVVGGDPRGRGVVSTCSYEARKFGIRSAMPASQAFRLCPQAVFLRPRFDAYQAVSELIHSIMRQYTDLVESVSLDEAYLDVTHYRFGIEDPVMIASLLKQHISAATRLSASAGVAPNMFLAKVASDYQKPGGLTVIRPGDVLGFLKELPVRKIPGVGPVTEKELVRKGIKTCGDLNARGPDSLHRDFGETGFFLYERSCGIDHREVEPYTEPKQISSEETFRDDTRDLLWLKRKLRDFAKEICSYLSEKKRIGTTVILKVKYFDFEQITRSYTPRHYPSGWGEVYEIGSMLLTERTRAGQKPVRLLGLGISGLRPVEEANRLRTPDLFSNREVER